MSMDILLRLAGMIVLGAVGWRLGLISSVRNLTYTPKEGFVQGGKYFELRFDRSFDSVALGMNTEIDSQKRGDQWIINNKLYAKIYEVERLEKTSTNVFSFTLDGQNHTYLGDHICSHNCDDLELDENVQTPDQRRKLMEWWQKAILPMLDPKVGKVVVIGTILHFDSLLANLLSQSDMYVTKIYKAINDDGTYLWPERLSPQFLEEQKKKMGGSAFSQEYLNTPLDEDTQVFRPEWFKWYTYPEDVFFDPIKDSWMFKGKDGLQKLKIIQSVDPALDGQDEFCMMIIGVTPQGEVVVLDMMSDHIDFPTQVSLVEQWNAEWVPDVLAIEGQAYQGALPQQLEKNGKILTEINVVKRKMNTQAGKAKEIRIKRLSPFVSSGQVFLRKAGKDEPGFPDPMNVLQIKIHPKTYKLYEQAVQYPSSKNDDRLDAFEIAFSSADVKPWFEEFESVRSVEQWQ